MTIAENELQSWSKLGPSQQSIQTHEEIRGAIEKDFFPPEARWKVYLKGSYSNSSNTKKSGDT